MLQAFRNVQTDWRDQENDGFLAGLIPSFEMFVQMLDFACPEKGNRWFVRRVSEKMARYAADAEAAPPRSFVPSLFEIAANTLSLEKLVSSGANSNLAIFQQAQLEKLASLTYCPFQSVCPEVDTAMFGLFIGSKMYKVFPEDSLRRLFVHHDRKINYNNILRHFGSWWFLDLVSALPSSPRSASPDASTAPLLPALAWQRLADPALVLGDPKLPVKVIVQALKVAAAGGTSDFGRLDASQARFNYMTTACFESTSSAILADISHHVPDCIARTITEPARSKPLKLPTPKIWTASPKSRIVREVWFTSLCRHFHAQFLRKSWQFLFWKPWTWALWGFIIGKAWRSDMSIAKAKTTLPWSFFRLLLRHSSKGRDYWLTESISQEILDSLHGLGAESAELSELSKQAKHANVSENLARFYTLSFVKEFERVDLHLPAGTTLSGGKLQRKPVSIEETIKSASGNFQQGAQALAATLDLFFPNRYKNLVDRHDSVAEAIWEKAF